MWAMGSVEDLSEKISVSPFLSHQNINLLLTPFQEVFILSSFQWRNNDGRQGGTDGPGAGPRGGERGEATPDSPTVHRVEPEAAGRVREARLQTLRLQEETQPRPQQSEHDGGQGNDVS